MTKITQLPVATTITDTGVFVIVDGGTTKQLTWQTLRSGGLKGDQGATGNTGTTGATGPMGTIATIQIGTVSLGTTATVTVSTSTMSASVNILDFILPQGEKGDTGVVDWEGIVNNIVPITTDQYSLGSPEFRWKDLYLSGNSLYIGSSLLSTTSTTVDVLVIDVENNFENTGTLISTSTMVVDSVQGIEIGATFILQDTEESLTVTDIIDDVIYFSPEVTITSLFNLPADVTITNPGSLVIDGQPIDVPAFTLTTATETALGGVKIGENIDIEDGVISVAFPAPYELSTASSVTLGGVKIGTGIDIDSDGVITVTTGSFALQTATASSLGGVKIGQGIDVSSSGTISVNTGLSLASSLTGSVLSSSITASSLTSLGTLTGITVRGTTLLQQTVETYSEISSSSGIVIHDCSQGTIFTHTNPLGNWTANFTNMSTVSNTVLSVALVVIQGSTPFIPIAVTIDSSPQIINWQGGISPTGNANKKDLINFTFISPIGTSTTYTVLGSLSSYG